MSMCIRTETHFFWRVLVNPAGKWWERERPPAAEVEGLVCIVLLPVALRIFAVTLPVPHPRVVNRAAKVQDEQQGKTAGQCGAAAFTSAHSQPPRFAATCTSSVDCCHCSCG